jgi:hypothetical protein
MHPLARFHHLYGVDFSGAKLAGHNTWVACLARHNRRWRLDALNSLGALAGTADRAPALAHLAALIAQSEGALWAIDFPFAMPVEVMPKGYEWDDQLADVARYRRGAYALGLRCVARSKRCADKLHIRRQTDTEAKTPFDCYHYRIIYQTFHGMRDVLHPLRRHRRTAVLPFDYGRLPRAANVVIESCPASFLKRQKWPHQNYKQPAGGPLTPKRRRTRHEILAHVRRHVALSDGQVRTIMRNPGGDALDAVLAALGAALHWDATDHRAVRRHPRYRREGYVYA